MSIDPRLRYSDNLGACPCIDPPPPDNAIAAMILLTAIAIGLVVAADIFANWMR